MVKVNKYDAIFLVSKHFPDDKSITEEEVEWIKSRELVIKKINLKYLIPQLCMSNFT